MMIDINTTYYVTDWYFDRILMYDEDWNFVEYEYFSTPRYICVIDNNLYITRGGGVIYKTDKYLNLLNLYYSTVIIV
jgi:hypothetical protein